ncbi:MAG TPA: DHA2 family efflux MFS transporter permease subunit [Sporichthyaceae bacterium]|nr:DHA2 family efflux MFS transporter permease subunit [Sporichthyaceae bacterium]
MALAATVAASGMAMLDGTIVNVAVPHIGRSLHAGVASLQWVLTGYLLALASLILLAGALGDRFGRRRVFVVGVAWFALASLLCGLAPSIGWLIAARILQGIGGALLTPGSLAIIQSSFRLGDRAAAVGAWAGLGGAAGALGPLIGGTLIDGPGWRWAFLLNLPVAVMVIVCTYAAVPETKGHEPGRLDLTGAALAVATLAAGTWALIEAGPRGWGDARVVVAAVISVVGLGAFVVHLCRAEHPLVPPSLFANRVFSMLNLGTLFLYASVGLSFFLVAYQLQTVAGWTALQAGLALLPTTLLTLALSARSGALAGRIGPRRQLTLGPLATAGGLLLLTRVGSHPTWATDVLPGAVLLGLGLVAFVAPLTAGVMAAADPDHVSTASSVNNAVARAASLAGLAVIPAVSGLATAHGGIDITHAYRVALVIAAVVAAVASPVFYLACGKKPPTHRGALSATAGPTAPG